MEASDEIISSFLRRDGGNSCSHILAVCTESSQQLPADRRARRLRHRQEHHGIGRLLRDRGGQRKPRPRRFRAHRQWQRFSVRRAARRRPQGPQRAQRRGDRFRQWHLHAELHRHGDRPHAVHQQLGVGRACGGHRHVTNSQVLDNGSGIVLGQRASVSGCTVNNNAGTGISLNIGSTATGNAVGRNGGTGIFMAEGGLVANSVSRNNQQYGVLMDCPGTVVSSTVSNNLAFNISQPGGSGSCDEGGTCCLVIAHTSTINSF
jgi:hypothetical protein